LIDLEQAYAYRGQRLFLEHGSRREEVRLEPVDHFTAEMDHFSGCVLDDRAPTTPGEEGLADMRIIEAIAEAARTRKAVRLSS